LLNSEGKKNILWSWE